MRFLRNRGGSPEQWGLIECIRRGEEARGDHARFCSPACRLAAHREGKRPPGRPLCAHCGRPVDGLPPAARVFTFSASRANFCSSRCRVAAWRKAHPSLKAATKAAEAARVAAIAADFALVEARAEVARVTAKGETITEGWRSFKAMRASPPLPACARLRRRRCRAGQGRHFRRDARHGHGHLGPRDGRRDGQ